MPTLPWTAVNEPAPDATAFVMASRLEVRSLKDVPRFFLRSLAAWKQVRSAPGAYGASLIAEPLKRTFWTLSAWEDRQALYTYARTEPHKSVMTGLRSTMNRSVFTFWETPTASLPIDWSDARDRLAAQERADTDGNSPTA
jgi:heme-degrading monooxygenase HmoA